MPPPPLPIVIANEPSDTFARACDDNRSQVAGLASAQHESTAAHDGDDGQRVVQIIHHHRRPTTFFNGEERHATNENGDGEYERTRQKKQPPHDGIAESPSFPRCSDSLEVEDGQPREVEDGQPRRRQRGYYSQTCIERFLTSNLVSDDGMLDAYRRCCRGAEACFGRGRRCCRRSSVDYRTVIENDGNDGIEHEGGDVKDDTDDDGGVAMVKLVKLVVLTLVMIAVVHPFARWKGWEVDDDYTLHDFILYDMTSVVLDLTAFFLVGRLHRRSGVDVLFPWGIFVLLGCIYPSIQNDFAFLRHSLSMYEMACNWPAILWAYVALIIVGAATLIFVHVRSHARHNVLPSRLLEIIVTALVLISPPVAMDDNFHLHHWYGMWLLGMHANAPEWWSRAFMAYCLGSYVNGIAVYGRDPVLGCRYAFYRSTSQSCGFMECYYEQEDGGGETNETHYRPYVAPNWRTCDSDVLP